MGRQLVPPTNDQPFTIIEDEDTKIEENTIEDSGEGGIISSILGSGAQSRIIERMNDWVVDRASENPGCVERFVCETYRTGETLSGIPYLMMSLTK